MIVFDIETGPLPEETIKANSKPFESQLGRHPGKFDPATVKTGNMKDQAKIDAKIEDARQKHTQAVADYESKAASEESDYWSDVISKAALSPLTGKVLAIGYTSTDTGKTVLDIDDDEAAMLTRFWSHYQKCIKENRKLVGHNSTKFDIRFIIRRSWILEVDVPQAIFQRGRYLDSLTLVDTMELWGEPVKLDVLAKVFGVGGKPDGVDGSMFAQLLISNREQAEQYLRNDLLITRAVAERMGVL
jgi:hypothetical protein